MMTCPLTFRAARPMIWRSDVFDRRNPIFSASRMPMNDVSGRSSHSRRRFTQTMTSISQRRYSLRVSRRSIVSISEWRYFTFTPFSARYVARSSEDFFVIVVMSARSFLDRTRSISRMSESTTHSIRSTEMSGSTSPVGRMTCSILICSCTASYVHGVAETKIVCPIFDSNSSNRSGRFSSADGSRNP